MRWVAPPPDLQPWTDGGVVVQAPATLAASHFPAMVGSMLVLRLVGAVHRAGVGPVQAAALIGPSTRPSPQECVHTETPPGGLVQAHSC